MVIATSYAIRQKTLPGFCPFLAVQQQSPGVTHIRDCLLAGGFAANPIGVGWFCGAEAPQTPQGACAAPHEKGMVSLICAKFW
jgi:hypothetical protein